MGFGLLAAALAFASVPAPAQDAGQAATNTPATDAIGPRELQNFNLNGTVTTPAEPQPAARAPTQSSNSSTKPTASRAASPRAASPTAQVEKQPVAQPETQVAARATEDPPRASAPSSSVTVALPKLRDDLSRGGSVTATPVAAPSFADPEPAGTLAPERKLSFLPWLLAAIALGAGGAFLFYRRKHAQEAFAGGPQVDAFLAPEPAAPTPAPEPVPVPPARPPSSIPGLVSTRLRPWIDFGFQPLRCIVEDHQITVEFELELMNSGNGPARAVLVEATMFNAGPKQDSEIESFFAHPVGEGDRIPLIEPLKRMVLRPKVVIAREHVQEYEVAGRKVFVPLIAFNALYLWSGGEGQSSISYLIGRDTKGEKMAPIRLDLGSRVFRGLGARAMPTGVRK